MVNFINVNGITIEKLEGYENKYLVQNSVFVSTDKNRNILDYEAKNEAGKKFYLENIDEIQTFLKSFTFYAELQS